MWPRTMLPYPTLTLQTAQAVCAGAHPACRAVFLHVATYNGAACAFYRACGFQEVARLPAFYHIACVCPALP